MLQIDPTINDTGFSGLKVTKLWASSSCETLLISLEKGHTFPEHTSPRDALLVLLEGKVLFRINNSEIEINKHEVFSFKAETPHNVFADKNSKFLIIR
ncbi:MAG: cupin domain-containing protein [Flavobacteriaceae bacterium]|nr:cupin domain-containing protein [Flavobacteriaceae bacterium]